MTKDFDYPRNSAPSDPEQVRVLQECIDLMKRKSADYQNPASDVKQADYYPSGVKTIHEVIWGKVLRVKSLLDAEVDPQNESLEDAFKDIANYSAIAVAYLRHKVVGQDPHRDHLNRPIREMTHLEMGDD